MVRFVLLAVLAVTALADDFPIVQTKLGFLRGLQTERGQKFLGIPFAEPPARWAEPGPKTLWKGVRNALYYGPDCASECVH